MSVKAQELGRSGNSVRRKLFLNRNFACLWIGQSGSMIGSSISFIGLPLVAVLIVHVTPFELGLITAAERLPPILVGPFVGPIVDRHSRYRIVLVADIGRALLLISIPVALIFGGLRYWQLLLVAFLVGVLTLFFNVAFQAYLPSLVPKTQIAVANARLGASQSMAEVTGPGLAAGLIALGGAAVAVAADAVSFIFSASFIAGIDVRDAERRKPGAPDGQSTLSRFWSDTRIGFGLLWREDILRTVTRSNAILTFFAQMQSAVYFLFLIKDLRFSAGLISIAFTAAGVIGLLSAFWLNHAVERIEPGRLIIIGQLILALGGILLASATDPIIKASILIAAGETCFGIGFTIFSVGYQTLFQLQTPDDVRGRVIGAARFITSGPVVLAALIAGIIGTVVGLRATLVVGAVGMVLGLAAVIQPRIWRFKSTS